VSYNHSSIASRIKPDQICGEVELTNTTSLSHGGVTFHDVERVLPPSYHREHFAHGQDTIPSKTGITNLNGVPAESGKNLRARLTYGEDEQEYGEKRNSHATP